MKWDSLRLSYDFVKEFIEKEGYILLSSTYKNSQDKIKIKCNNNHVYFVSFNNFKNGSRCSKCYHNKLGKKQKHSYDFIKKQIEKEGYKLLSKEYRGSKQKIKIMCDKNHIYETTFNSFQQGRRCPKCKYIKQSDNQKHSYYFVKQKIEKEGYKLLSTEYKNANTKLKIVCDLGHEYEVKYNDFKQGYRCPKCSNRISNGEKEVVDFLKSLNIEVIENDRSIIPPLELDIVVPEKKLAIEYCGLYWHSELRLDKNYHSNKLEQCNKAGYRLITIFEDEWLNKQEIVKSRLKYILGLEENRIYARKCTVKEISKIWSKEFIEKYHIQGYSSSSLCLGAFYNSELVAVMTFGKRGKSIYELNRFCTSTNVVGVFSKILKYFEEKNSECKEIITFADRRWSEGDLYKKIGFEKDKELNPDYSYFKTNRIRFHKFGFRHYGMKNKLENYNPNLTERENMLNNNYYRIYDCGKIRWRKKCNG
jgi:hypothetical protein